MEEPLDADSRTRETLIDLLKDLISFFKEEQNIPAKLSDEIRSKYSHVLDALKQKLKELSDPIYIVVSGEISAGKSSLLNLLIGNDVLPESPLQCTSVKCQLRHSDHTYAELVGKNQEKQTFHFNESEEALTDLQDIIQGEKENANVCHIDIMVKQDILKGNVVLVDTPGIAEESTDDNTILTECLKKACAFIYVIKSDSNGGTHQLFRILEHVRNLQCNKETDLDPKCIMYICNKWDLVEGNEEKVFKTTRFRKNSIPMTDDQFNLLSVKKEKKRRRKGKEHSQEYLRFKQRLKEVINYAAGKKLKFYSEWIVGLCHDITKSVEFHLIDLSKDVTQKKEMKGKAEDKVNVLQDILKKPKEAVLNEAQDRYKKLSVQLEDFLRTKDIIQDCVKSVIAKITTPELDSFQEIQNRCKKLCYEYINSKISNWLRDNKPENACDDLKGQTL